MIGFKVIVLDGKSGEKEKEMNFVMPDIKKLAVGTYIFSAVTRGVNKMRPPKRNAGMLLNLYVAGLATKAIMGLIFKEEEVKEEANETEEKDVSIRWEVVDKDGEEEKREEE